MHASAMARRTPNRVLERGDARRHATVGLAARRGATAFYTIDAGPHVKVLCAADARRAPSTRRWRRTPGVVEPSSPRPGAGARVLQEARHESDQRNTLRGAPVVTAPGKVFLIGEYAVLWKAGPRSSRR